MPKTVVIWDELDADLKFFVAKKDLSHLNGMYLNSMDTPEKEADEINNLVYNDKDGSMKVELLVRFPIEAVREGASVITMGFLP